MKPVISRKMMVNAAFLQEVKDSNTELWLTLTQLENLRQVNQEKRIRSRQLVMLLGRLRECVALEFSLEETYGFLSTGGLSTWQDATEAMHQHRDLYLQIHELCEQAEEAEYRGTISRDLDQYLDAFDDFHCSFVAHEAMEGELIRLGLGV
ncbi:MAG: hypothetical protein KDB03_18385 [Planctomycetales bacterium]|nr:hypothetical protein [Planctomycetales bacterium]